MAPGRPSSASTDGHRVAIPQETIDAIRERTDIVEIVSRYVELRRSGRNLRGLCPFHQEKTPSFYVDPERQMFKCFGCGQGGNVFTFLMEMEGVSFPEAVRTLGRECGVEVSERPGRAQRRELNDRLYAANRFAARFYHDRLVRSPGARAAREYLESRGFDRDVWVHFGLGYAPPSWDALGAAARRAGIPAEDLEAVRLVLPARSGRGRYDVFRNRVIFPIVRPGARVVALAGRALGDEEPKYINSAESPVFEKRRTFYGLDRARDAIRERGEALVVEGYTDVIRLHVTGFEHAVAVCGTSLTPEHARALRRITRRAVLMPDGDEAGQRAAVGAGAALLAAGLDVGVVRLEPDDDPDSAVRRLGRDGIEKTLGAAIDYFDFLDYIVRERARSAREREAVARRAIDALAALDDPVRRDVVLGRVADVLAINPDDLRERVQRAARRGQKPVDGGPGPVRGGAAAPGRDVETAGGGDEPVDPERARRERLVLHLLLDRSPATDDAMETLDAEDFTVADHRKFYNLLDLARESHIDTSSTDFRRRAEAEGLEALAADIALTPVPPGNLESLLRDTVRRIKRQRIEDELGALRRRLLDVPADSDEAVEIAEYFRRLQQALSEM